MKGRLHARWLAADGMTLDEFVAASVLLGMQGTMPSLADLAGLQNARGYGPLRRGSLGSPLAHLFFGQ